MNLFRRKRRFPVLVMAAVMLLFTWDVPVEAEETEAVETEEMAEAEETVSYGSPENGEDYERAGGRLGFIPRSEAASYLDWLLPAWAVCRQEVTLLSGSDLLQENMEEEQGREYLRQRLRTFEREASEEKQEEVEKLRLLRERMESVYPHENLKNL